MNDAQEKRPFSSSETVAVRVLYARSSRTGEQLVVHARVSRPYWVVDGVEAACLAGVEELFGPLREIRGIDHLDALRNATIFVYQLLGGRQDDYELRWPNGEPFEPPD